jgi:esterase/lipase
MLERDISLNNLSTTVRIKDVRNYLMSMNFELIKGSLNMLSKVSPGYTSKKALEIFCTPRKSTKFRKIVHPVFKQAIEKDIFVAGKTVKTFRFGEGEKTILLVHGWEGRAWDFGVMIKSLTENGYCVITFDGPAHGDSSGNKTTILEFTKVIENLSLEFDGFEAIVGHSFGGCATLIALERIKTIKANKVITLGSPNKMKNVFRNFSKFMNLSQATEEGMNRLLTNLYGKEFTSVSLEEIFSTLKIEGMLIHDIGDRMVSFDSALEIHERNPNLKLLQTSQLGHVRVLRNKHVLQEMVDYLSEK